nr:ABC transporter permease [Motilibacter aurantiacus]
MLLEHTWVTTQETIIGFVLATVIGVATAVLLVYSKTAEKALYPLILFAQVIPKIAIAPILVVWFGFGLTPKIVLAVLIAFFPVVVSGVAGLRSVDPELLELSATMGASRWKTFTKIRFPTSLPQLMSGLKVAVTLAVVGAVVGEFVGADRGLGYVLLLASGNLDAPLLFADLILMSAIGILLFVAIEALEGLLIPWHSSRRENPLLSGS